MKMKSQFMSMSTLFGVMLLTCVMLFPAVSFATSTCSQNAVWLPSVSNKQLQDSQACLITGGGNQLTATVETFAYLAENAGATGYLYDETLGTLVWSETDYTANGGQIQGSVTAVPGHEYQLVSTVYWTDNGTTWSHTNLTNVTITY